MAEKLPDFNAMTIEKIDEWKVAHKQKIEALQEDYNVANAARIEKVQHEHEQEAIKQIIEHAEAEGKAPVALAKEWLSSDQPGRQTQAELFLGTHRSQSND